MAIRPASEILKDIETTRKEIGTVTPMMLDGAQVHFMFESMLEALKVVAELLIVSKHASSDEWKSNYGSREDTLKSARELGRTAISSIKTFMEATPANLRDYDKVITPDKLDYIESFFTED